jgi:hypothetical protein
MTSLVERKVKVLEFSLAQNKKLNKLVSEFLTDCGEWKFREKV